MRVPFATGKFFFRCDFETLSIPENLRVQSDRQTRWMIGCRNMRLWRARHFTFGRMFRGKKADSLQKSRMADRNNDPACGWLLRDVAACASGEFAGKRPVRTLSLHGSPVRLCISRTVLEEVLLFHQPRKNFLGRTNRREGARIRCCRRGSRKSSENRGYRCSKVRALRRRICRFSGFGNYRRCGDVEEDELESQRGDTGIVWRGVRNECRSRR